MRTTDLFSYDICLEWKRIGITCQFWVLQNESFFSLRLFRNPNSLPVSGASFYTPLSRDLSEMELAHLWKVEREASRWPWRAAHAPPFESINPWSYGTRGRIQSPGWCHRDVTASRAQSINISLLTGLNLVPRGKFSFF